jgi:hypothetical protein
LNIFRKLLKTGGKGVFFRDFLIYGEAYHEAMPVSYEFSVSHGPAVLAV